MTLTAQGKVSLHTTTYPLDAINDAMADLDGGRLQGRGILIPAGAWHTLENNGNSELRFLCCCAPPYADEDTFFE